MNMNRSAHISDQYWWKWRLFVMIRSDVIESLVNTRRL